MLRIQSKEAAIRICALAFLLGVMLVQQTSELPTLWWSLLLIPSLYLAYRNPRWLPLTFLIFAVVWTAFRAGIILQESLPAELEGKNIQVEGFIASLPKQYQRGVRFDFDVKQAKYQGSVVQIPPKLQLRYYANKLKFHPGERWGLTVRLKRIHGFMNPGGFDYEAYLFQHRIRARGYLHLKSTQQRLGKSEGYWLLRLRYALGQHLHQRLGAHPMGGMVRALINGDRGGISTEQWQVLRRTGTNHLVAISGLHVGFIAGIAFWLGSRLWAWPGVTVLIWPAAKVGAIAAIIVAIAYAALAGFSIPTQRALIMLSVIFLGILINRRFQPTQYLAFAMLAVLLFDPMAVISAGFWLSFSAVAIILLILANKSSSSRLWRFGRIQGLITIGLFPLTLILFQQASLVAPLANLIAVPLFTMVIVPLSLLGAVALVLVPDAIGTVVFTPVLWLLSWLWYGLARLATFDLSLWTQHRPVPWTWFCALVGILLLLAPRPWPLRWLGLLWLAPMFLVLPAGPQGSGTLWISTLDVGQGLSVVVRSQHHVLVFDTGARYSPRFDTGSVVVLPYLRDQGIKRIDTLIISHGDNDHIGGSQTLLQGIPVRRILSGAKQEVAHAERCRQGQRWQVDGVVFRILNPPLTKAKKENNNSCVVLVTSPYGSLLLTGDIERQAEQRLIKAYADQLRSRILIAPHHGSKTSSSMAFIQAVQPKYVIFPVGYRNRYRHPHPLVVARYREFGSRLFQSPEHGTITIKLDGRGTHIDRHRQSARRYWHHRL